MLSSSISSGSDRFSFPKKLAKLIKRGMPPKIKPIIIKTVLKPKSTAKR